MADAPVRCGGCPATWGGTSAAHCSACHVTFSGITIFDEHQKAGKCLSVSVMVRRGVREVRPGVFGRPTPAQRGAKSPSKGTT